MASADAQTAAPSNAQKRVVAILTEAEDPVIYSSNPAELPHCRLFRRVEPLVAVLTQAKK